MLSVSQAALIAAALETFVHAKKAARFRRRESRISGDEDADGGESDSDRFDGSPVISLNVLLPTQYSVRASESKHFRGLVNHYDRLFLYIGH